MIYCINNIEWDTEFKIVYFDTDGSIISFANRVDEKSTYEYEYFLLDDIIDFMNGTLKHTNYKVVFQQDRLIYAIERISSSTFVTTNALYHFSNKIEYSDNPDILIKLTSTGLTIQATKKLGDFFIEDRSTDITILQSTSHAFYITLKDQPDFLLDTTNIRFADILSGEEIAINYEHKYNISIYTNRVFDIYSLGD